MKIIKRIIIIRNVILLSYAFAGVALILGFMIAMTVEQGLAGGGPYLSEILFYIANWPSLLLKIYPTITTMHGTVVHSVEHGFFNPLIIISNAIGWTSVGFIIGLIISAVKGKRRLLEE
jgi:hypothetical protein